MPKNLGVDTFPDPVGHFGPPCRPFPILQAVRHYRQWAIAPFADRLVLYSKVSVGTELLEVSYLMYMEFTSSFIAMMWPARWRCAQKLVESNHTLLRKRLYIWNHQYFDHIFNVFSKLDDQNDLITFAWCQSSPDTSLEYPQRVLWRD